MENVYNIIEIANVHGGDKEHLLSLIDEFKEFTHDFGMKFQPFKYDEIATSDFEWYPVYEKLFFSPQEWGDIFAKAKETKDIWIDVFDGYSVQIVKEYLADIVGLKFQTSVLDNRKLFKDLSEIDLRNIKVIINIAGHEMDEIKNYAERIEKELKPQELILQVGFQGYPTKLEDSGLNKIKILKDELDYKISFTEHIDPTDEECIRLPVAAALLGALIIEKHVRHSTRETLYDFYSSVPVAVYGQYIDLLKQTTNNDTFLNEKELALLEETVPFINDAEGTYLRKSKQKPLANHFLALGTLLSFERDLSFKRSAKEGLPIDRIESLVRDFHVLGKEKETHDAFEQTDFRKAVIATVIACRMKSTRLPKKAILKVGALSSIELCIKHALTFDHVEYTVLATSTTAEDEILKDYTYDPAVVFYQGDPDDVIERYIGVADRLGIDVIIRVTGDMQYVSKDIAELLLRSHFDTGADYTHAKEAAVGTNLEIMNVPALKKIKTFFPRALYSEYMSYYFWNNPEYFHLNVVDLPKSLVRDYRLTLDYAEDLALFQHIEEYFSMTGKPYSLAEVFAYLDSHRDIARLNEHCVLKYKTDPELIATLNRETTIH